MKKKNKLEALMRTHNMYEFASYAKNTSAKKFKF